MRIIKFNFNPQEIPFILQEDISILSLMNALNDEIQGAYQSEHEQFKIETIDFTEFENTYKDSLDNIAEFDWLLSQLESFLIDNDIIKFISDIDGIILPK